MTARKRAGKVQRVVVNAPKPASKKPMKISDETKILATITKQKVKSQLVELYSIPKAMPGVKSKTSMAMDSSMESGAYAFAIENTIYSEGQTFLGYPYLSELYQRPEYRRPSEIIAKEMTRKWIKLTVSGDEDKADKIKLIESEIKRLNLQGVTRKLIEHDGAFGRGQVFVDVGYKIDDPEMQSPLVESANKLPKGGLKRLVNIEPIWTYPNKYETADPTDEYFYRPETWSVMGNEIHCTRLLTLVSRPVADLLKPAYAFGGLSLTQMGKPYVDNWLRTRQAVSDLVHSFSVSGIKTDLEAALTGTGGNEMFDRADLFIATKDNSGLMMLNKDEEFFNVSTPLSTLDALQAQAQEHMSAVYGIPLVVLLGITPSGLNASSDGEMRAYFNWVESQQECLRPFLSRILNLIQLNIFGEIDSDIDFKFEPLWTMNEKELAEIRKIEMDTDAVAIEAGVISQEESRQRLAGEEGSPYAGIDLAEDLPEPEPPEDDEEMKKFVDGGEPEE